MLHLAKGEKLPLTAFWLGLSLIYALVFTTIELTVAPISGLRGLMEMLLQWCIVAFCSSGIIGLIVVNRYVCAIALPILLIASSVLAYFQVSLGLTLTPMCIELALVNNMATYMTVISWQLVLSILLVLAVSIAIVVFRFRRVGESRQWLILAASIVIVLLPTCIVDRISAPVMNRMPYTFGYNLQQYLVGKQHIQEERHTFDNVAVERPDDAPDLIFILGESLRADHVSMNGYKRETFPRLSRDTALISLPNITTVPYYTHTSVPHILTRADSIHPDLAYDEQSFITLFKKAHYTTSWLSNQDNVNTYAYFIHEADTVVYANAARTPYSYDKWTDMDLLPELDKALSAAPKQPKLVVLHSVGSHWWYPAHYPDSLARFKPEVNSKVVSELSRQQMINSYDNTILATDLFLSGVINRLQHRNAVMIFISDHGEALGEDGRYLHGEDYPELHNPAMFVWYSNSWAQANPEKVAALKANRLRCASTDMLFHSALDAVSLKTDVLDKSLSIFFNEKN
jgi:glucan phosphoethanolaminetransferase (alkaline phosphatase superfamily)